MSDIDIVVDTLGEIFHPKRGLLTSPYLTQSPELRIPRLSDYLSDEKENHSYVHVFRSPFTRVTHVSGASRRPPRLKLGLMSWKSKAVYSYVAGPPCLLEP